MKGRKALSEKWHKRPSSIWCYDDKIYVLAAEGARAEVLRRHHNDLLARHFSYAQTLELIQQKYFWPGMAKTVKAYVRNCTAC